MRVRHEFPRRMTCRGHVWIPMRDGVRLSARIWLPDDAEPKPVPAILEYHPYRKNDLSSTRDATRHPYFAGFGYAAVRVDLRGSGDSEGLLHDEYLAQEQDDAVEVIAWLAQQPWCTGAVGMIGNSWGGFNSLQVAARRPPALKAIISSCSTDDRYADDVHYIGGCLNTSNLRWAGTMLTKNAQPPDPANVGDRWRAMWLERLDGHAPWIEPWLRHQRRDDYWRHGSVCEDYAAMTCAVLMTGGWADGYVNAIMRILAGYGGPRQGLIGPWAHGYGDSTAPGPAIGYLQECLRWWDYWLKGIDTGVMAEPMLRAWLQESARPSSHHDIRPGRWIGESVWPPARSDTAHWYLNASGRLDLQPEAESALDYTGGLALGVDGGVWCGYGRPGDTALDQRSTDGQSLTFTSDPLAEPIALLGYPRVALDLAADKPVAQIAVSLCEVWPDGASTLLTRGFLNLCHRNSHAEPTSLQPGQRYSVAVKLNAIGAKVNAGQRLRVAIATGYWPMVWPAPENVALTVFAGANCRLELPIRADQPADAALSAFAEPENSPPLAVTTLRESVSRRTVSRDLVTGLVERVDDTDGGQARYPSGLVADSWRRGKLSLVEGDPLSVECQWDDEQTFSRGNWRARALSRSRLTATRDEFHVTATVEAYEGDTLIFNREWEFAIPRDHV